MIASRSRLVLALLPLLLAGCDETDAVALRLQLDTDLSGTLTTSALELPPGPGGVGAPAGVEWNSSVSVVCNSGRFARLSDVKLFDLSCSGQANAEGLSFAQVTLPRGPDVQWAKALVPLSGEERTKAARALDPTGKSDAVGATIKIEVTLPATVIGNGLKGKTRGVKLSAEDEVATLIVPLETALTAGDPLVWHLTWEQ